MDENTLLILQTLATKLGTTVDFLWATLIKQAPIDGAFYLLLLAFLGAIGYGLFRWAKYNLQSNIDEIVWVPYGVATIFYLIAAIIALGYGPVAFSGFFNPDYWALKQIIGTVRK